MSLDKAELCDSLLTWVSSASFPSQANYRARGLTGDRQQVLAEEWLNTHSNDIRAKRKSFVVKRFIVVLCSKVDVTLVSTSAKFGVWKLSVCLLAKLRS